MRARRRLLLASLAFPLFTGSIPAQERAHLVLAPGTEVRITARPPASGTIVTRADGVSGDTLLLSAPSRRIPLADLAALEVRGGRDRRRGITIGAAGFGVVTAVAGGIDYHHGEISLGDFAGTILGNVVVGAALGYLFAPSGWLPLPLPGR